MYLRLHDHMVKKHGLYLKQDELKAIIDVINPEALVRYEKLREKAKTSKFVDGHIMHEAAKKAGIGLIVHDPITFLRKSKKNTVENSDWPHKEDLYKRPLTYGEAYHRKNVNAYAKLHDEIEREMVFGKPKRQSLITRIRNFFKTEP